jgi:Putative adhesin
MSRASVVAMLIAAEVLVVGMAIYALGHGRASWAAGMHHVDFSAATIAPIAAGSSPRVVIDDAASRVHVGVSPDQSVHVSDLTQMRGAVFSNRTYPQLRVTRTSDGVRIERPSAGSFSIEVFGFSKQAIQVDVPANSHVEIAGCAGADVFGITGATSVHSNDGHITLTDMQGSIDARSDDGYLSATNVRGDRLSMVSSDGHIALKDVAVGSLLAQSRDGRIEAEALSVTGDATLQTDDGSIALKLAPNANLTIDASTRDGHIVVDGNSLDRDDSAQRTIRLGSAAGTMKVATGDGSIHILTNGDSLQ